MFKPSFDKVVGAVVGLGVPGLFFLILLSTSPLAGGAALAAALSAFGPGGMAAGIISIPIAVLIFKGLSEYGYEKVLVASLKKMQEKGETKESLFKKIDNFKISEELKYKLKKHINELYDFDTQQMKDSSYQEKQKKDIKEKEEPALEAIYEEVEGVLKDILMGIIIKNTPNKLDYDSENNNYMIKEFKTDELKSINENKNSSLKKILKGLYISPQKNDKYDEPKSYLEVLETKYEEWIFDQLQKEDLDETDEEITDFFKPVFNKFLKKADINKYYDVLVHTTSNS